MLRLACFFLFGATAQAIQLLEYTVFAETFGGASLDCSSFGDDLLGALTTCMSACDDELVFSRVEACREGEEYDVTGGASSDTSPAEVDACVFETISTNACIDLLQSDHPVTNLFLSTRAVFPTEAPTLLIQPAPTTVPVMPPLASPVDTPTEEEEEESSDDGNKTAIVLGIAIPILFLLALVIMYPNCKAAHCSNASSKEEEGSAAEKPGGEDITNEPTER